MLINRELKSAAGLFSEIERVNLSPIVDKVWLASVSPFAPNENVMILHIIKLQNDTCLLKVLHCSAVY